MPNYQLRVEKGPELGRIDSISPEGATIGRSKLNAIRYLDEMLSRRHCSLYFHGEELLVADLATVNGTFVNGEQVLSETPLHAGDRLRIGGTELLLSDADGKFAETPAPTAEPAPEPATAAPTAESAPISLDLGLANVPLDAVPDSAAAAPTDPQARLRRMALCGACAAAAVLVVAFGAKLLLTRSAPSEGLTPVFDPLEEAQASSPVAFSYTKLEGSDSNLFRYQMDLGEDGALTVTIDDLAQDRHVRKTAQLSDEKRRELARKFETHRFTALEPQYEGLPRINTWAETRISARLFDKAKTVLVRNTSLPESFAALRDELDTFGQNELGLWAFAVGRDQLLKLANEQLQNAHRLYDEREILHANLFRAIEAYSTCLAYLDSFQPKPELYDDAVAGREIAKSELDQIVTELNWKADLGTNTRNWLQAQEALRTLLEYVPDRTDARYKDAEKRLIDVESRLRK